MHQFDNKNRSDIEFIIYHIKSLPKNDRKYTYKAITFGHFSLKCHFLCMIEP